MYHVAMSKPPRKKKPVSATASTGRRGRQLPARVMPSLWDALKAMAQEERRSVAQMVVILLEEALQLRRRWPPLSEENE